MDFNKLQKITDSFASGDPFDNSDVQGKVLGTDKDDNLLIETVNEDGDIEVTSVSQDSDVDITDSVDESDPEFNPLSIAESLIDDSTIWILIEDGETPIVYEGSLSDSEASDLADALANQAYDLYHRIEDPVNGAADIDFSCEVSAISPDSAVFNLIVNQ